MPKFSTIAIFLLMVSLVTANWRISCQEALLQLKNSNWVCSPSVPPKDSSNSRTFIVNHSYDSISGRLIVQELAPSDLTKEQTKYNALTKLSHPNLQNVLIAKFGFDYFVYLVVNPESGTWADILRTDAQTVRHPLNTLAIISKLASAVLAIHKNKMIHGNIRPANLLFNARKDPLLGGLNLMSTFTQSSGDLADLAFQDPLIWLNRIPSADMKSDVYSLGVLLYFMATGKTPFAAKNMEEWGKAIEDGVYILPEGLDRIIAHMVSSMIQKDPENRPRLDQIIKTITDESKTFSNEKISQILWDNSRVYPVHGDTFDLQPSATLTTEKDENNHERAPKKKKKKKEHRLLAQKKPENSRTSHPEEYKSENIQFVTLCIQLFCLSLLFLMVPVIFIAMLKVRNRSEDPVTQDQLSQELAQGITPKTPADRLPIQNQAVSPSV